MSVPPRVVIVGGGFAGLNCAKGLRGAACEVLLVDRSNHHTFQPLLYQVATAALAPSDVGYPIRRVFRDQSNLTVILGEVVGIDASRRCVRVINTASAGANEPPIALELQYDTLVVAGGAENSYFGHNEWATLAPSLKTIEDAVEIRSRMLVAFERAEIDADATARRRRLTFVIVGAGPTGVELAGAIKELAVDAIARDFRHIDTSAARVVLVEGGSRVLPAMHPSLSASAQRTLERMGVEVRLGAIVTGIDSVGVRIGGTPDDPNSGERLDAANVLWAAGVRASALGRLLAKETGVALDSAGRVRVSADLSLPAHPEIFVLGDMAHVEVDDGTGPGPARGPSTHGEVRTGAATSTRPIVPGVAPAAMQMGRFAARVIRARLSGRTPPARFHYTDKGSLATIGRSRAVAEIAGLRFRGFPAWVLWSVVHVAFLIGFRNRVVTLFSWFLSYVFFSKGSRLITRNTAPFASVPNTSPAEGASAPSPDGSTAPPEC